MASNIGHMLLMNGRCERTHLKTKTPSNVTTCTEYVKFPRQNSKPFVMVDDQPFIESRPRPLQSVDHNDQLLTSQGKMSGIDTARDCTCLQTPHTEQSISNLPLSSDRRTMLLSLAGLAFCAPGSAVASAEQPLSSHSLTGSCGINEKDRWVQGKMCRALHAAIRSSIIDLKVMPGSTFDSEVSRYWAQEYAFFTGETSDNSITSRWRRQQQSRRLEDVLEGGGDVRVAGLLTYITWKVVADHVNDPQVRRALVVESGRRLAADVAAAAVKMAQEAAKSGGGHASAADVQSAIQLAVQQLQASNFVCGHDVFWGVTPTLPAYGELSEDVNYDGRDVTDDVSVLMGEGSTSSSSSCNEEGEAGGQSGTGLLLPDSAALPSSSPSSSSSSSSSSDSRGDTSRVASGTVFQVKLYKPADIIGATALRAEQDGFWGQTSGSVLSAVLSAGGYDNTSVDEYFLQDEWIPPQSTAARVLLWLGDPLMQVQVPWEPTTLVQDWVIL